ncbi:sporulation integral membrane protein YlbJ [Bacillus sp. 165]|uniref:sporulation integral membrane protein YlbJ n=1 Tax=Bacillus sp. 165 TaxID=1529117 RepID=UPI001ADCA566|nr:sporulation integral membrane protein YlbJ [Bacillus sp. 165]MBO9130282.1 sporulation integral membrane protein YlbJ [Bacillus sp. 165]
MHSKIKTFILAGAVTCFTAALILNPQASLEASIRGVNIWWEVVFPSLLPFFIMSELLIGIGVVSFIGILLEPLMRPLFRVPGVGGFVWAMGMASGFPSGAKISARLRQNGQLTQTEAERLVSFTNSSNPLFIFGAVAVGFFNNPGLGILLAASHYISNFCVGLVMRFHGKDKIKEEPKVRPFSVIYAFQTLHSKRLEDKRPIGKLIGDAVVSSIQTLLMIGGFIILFSVINKMLQVIHITEFFASIIQYSLTLLHIPAQFSIPIFSGMFEITLGSQLTSQTENVSLLHQAMITSFILAFSGLSIQAQVASILAETDIRFRPYFFARFMQSFIAPLCTYVLWNPLYVNLHTFQQHEGDLPVSFPLSESWHTISIYGPVFTLVCLYVYVFLLLLKVRKQ